MTHCERSDLNLLIISNKVANLEIMIWNKGKANLNELLHKCIIYKFINELKQIKISLNVLPEFTHTIEIKLRSDIYNKID